MFIVILFNIIVYCIAFSFISNLGGYKKNLPFSFSLAIFIVYYLITPTYFFYSGRKTIWGDEKVFATVGVDISDYYVTVLLYYGIANIFYILGYIIPKTKKKFILKGKKLFEIKLINPQRTIVVLFSIIFFIVLANFVFYGFNISALLIGDESQALGGNAGLSN